MEEKKLNVEVTKKESSTFIKNANTAERMKE